MSEGETLLLGFIAGVTILLGLPLGRMRARRVALRQFLNALATGILLFLVWDVLTHAWEPIDSALSNLHNGQGQALQVLGYSLLFFGGLGVGLLGLVYYEQWFHQRYRRSNPAQSQDARHLCAIIAMGIGLHNFGEGLAIGASAAAGELGLATVLVIGFALHNATEGFGIVAPLAAAGQRPSWGFLLLLGLI